MKRTFLFWFLVIINTLLLIVLLFFREKFLFFLLGYDFDLKKSTSIESFKAHAIVQKFRIGLILLTFITGLFCLIISRNLSNHSGSWYFSIGVLLGIINFILALILIIMAWFVPNRIF